jgi:hypothetical protein
MMQKVSQGAHDATTQGVCQVKKRSTRQKKGNNQVLLDG